MSLYVFRVRVKALNFSEKTNRVFWESRTEGQLFGADHCVHAHNYNINYKITIKCEHTIQYTMYNIHNYKENKINTKHCPSNKLKHLSTGQAWDVVQFQNV